MASFCTKLLQDYYDYTMNTTFLRHHAYPLTKLNGEFYLSYMTRQDGRYNVMHGCGMEGCNAQGANESGNLTYSNNAPPVRRKHPLCKRMLSKRRLMSLFFGRTWPSPSAASATSCATRRSSASMRSSGLRGRMCWTRSLPTR